MSRKQKIFTQILSFGVASLIGANIANAAEDGVLFKIHDIVPVKNSEGLVTSCDLGATFYNRTASSLSDVSLSLEWEDEVITDEIDIEERTERENRRANHTSRPRYTTSTYSDKNVFFNLRLPPLKPAQQITLKSKVKTDRCFLLLNDMEIKVNSCNVNGGKSEADCKGLFQFISVKNPEYYSEFQSVSEMEMKKQDISFGEKKQQEIEEIYNQADANIKQIGAMIQK